MPKEPSPEDAAEPLPEPERLSAPAPLTPMLRQYAEAKAQAKDALLLFRLGDFYELFYDDARVASQLLGITLTARSKAEERVPMAGVPYHAARGYIARLVAAGHKVAICDQMEAPGPGKSLVKREIVRLVTPGTLLDDDSLDAREPLLLAAVIVAPPARKRATPTAPGPTPPPDGPTPLPLGVTPHQVDSGPLQVGPGPLQVDSGPLQVASGPLQVASGPLQVGSSPLRVGAGPLQVGPGPLQVGPGPLQVGPGPLRVGPGPLRVGPGPHQVGSGPPAGAATPLEAGALALLDASTGELRVQATSTWEQLLDELGRARPRELLVPEELAGTPRERELRLASGALRLEPRPFRDPASAELLLKRHLGLGTLDGIGLSHAPLAVQACAEALLYLQETQRSGARHVVRVQLEQSAHALWIDPAAVRNLELFRGPEGRRAGTLCQLVDRTHTAAGGRLLARWLAAPLVDAREIGARHDAVEELSQAAVAREELAARLKTVLDIERLLGRLAVRQGTPRELASLRASLRELPELSNLCATRLSNRLRALAPPLAALGALSDLLARALADEVPAAREPGFVRPGFRAALDELVDLAQGGRAAIAALEAAEKARAGIASLKVRYNRVSGFYIEITKSNLHLVPADYQRRSSTVGAERFVTPALLAHEAKVLAAEERRAAMEAEIFDELTQAVLAGSAALRAAAAAAAEVDALLSFARVAAEAGWVRPRVDDGLAIDIRGGRHPVVEKALQQSGDGPFVPNDLLLDETRRLLVLTGPNMAGKSTAMRQVALIAILAQAGSFVPAASARIGIVDKLFTRVGAADDLARGQSTFMVEMAECARILAQATPRSLLLLDEVGRGTSTFDGLAIAWAVAEHLHDQVRARTLFATHYHELCDLAAEREQAVNLTMAVSEVAGKVVFLRKLVPGAASRSYGIQVAKLAGLPEGVVSRAKEILRNLESQELDESGRAALAHGPRASRRERPQLGLFESSRVAEEATPAAGAARAVESREVASRRGAGDAELAAGTSAAASSEVASSAEAASQVTSIAESASEVTSRTEAPREVTSIAESASGSGAARPDPVRDDAAARLRALGESLRKLELSRMTPLEALLFLDAQQKALTGIE